MTMLCYWLAYSSVDSWQDDRKLWGEKEISKKDGSLGVMVCMPIVFSRAEKSKATFP